MLCIFGNISILHFTSLIFKVWLFSTTNQIIKLFSINYLIKLITTNKIHRRKSSTSNRLKKYFWFNFKQLNFNATFRRATLRDTAMLAGWHVNVSWLTSDLPPIHHPLFHPLKRLTTYVPFDPTPPLPYPFFPSFYLCLGFPFSSFSFLLSPTETVYHTSSSDLTYPYLRKSDVRSGKII